MLAFQDCNLEKITKTDNLHESSDFYGTIILNNDEDQMSQLFDEEENSASFFKMSQSIR